MALEWKKACKIRTSRLEIVRKNIIKWVRRGGEYVALCFYLLL